MSGLENRFMVFRRDGRDFPGGNRADAEYFVLDVKHDPTARLALLSYANNTHHDELADDLFRLLDRLEGK